MSIREVLSYPENQPCFFVFTFLLFIRQLEFGRPFLVSFVGCFSGNASSKHILSFSGNQNINQKQGKVKDKHLERKRNRSTIGPQHRNKKRSISWVHYRMAFNSVKYGHHICWQLSDLFD